MLVGLGSNCIHILLTSGKAELRFWVTSKPKRWFWFGVSFDVWREEKKMPLPLFERLSGKIQFIPFFPPLPLHSAFMRFNYLGFWACFDLYFLNFGGELKKVAEFVASPGGRDTGLLQFK